MLSLSTLNYDVQICKIAVCRNMTFLPKNYLWCIQTILTRGEAEMAGKKQWSFSLVDELASCHGRHSATAPGFVMKTHLKTHRREILKKCDQCEFESDYACALRTHLKTHIVEKSRTNVSNVSLRIFIQTIQREQVLL